MNIHQAVRDCNLSAIDIFLNNGGNIEEFDEDGETPLSIALEVGRVKKNFEVARKLLAEGANPNHFDENKINIQPIIVAAEYTDIATFLDFLEVV